jgi:hypothetical protein
MNFFERSAIMRLIVILIIVSLTLLPALNAEENKYLDYTVKKGDTLWDITEDNLEDPFLWPKVWKENPFIANPDLIFPGQRLRIPLYLGQEQIELVPVEEEVLEKVIVKEVIVKKVPRLEEKPIPVPPKEPFIAREDLIAAGGYIGDDLAKLGQLATTPTGRTVIGIFDDAYLELNGGAPAEVGRKFYTIRPLGKIKHPVTGDYMGKLLIITGVVEVIGEEAGYIKSKVIKSYDVMQVGDSLDEYYPIDPLPMIRVMNPSVHGMVVGSRYLKFLSAQFDYVYLDMGSSNGIVPGNVFALTSGEHPNRPIAEIQVISTKEKTSTALVIKSNVEVSPGDYF